MKDVSKEKVTIIIVAAGRREYLKSCLDSAKKQTYPHIEFIVVDNSLNREFSEEFRNSYPEVKFFISQTNLFYCEALNKGIEASKGKFILCLNDDVILDKDFIREALSGFKVSQKVGMVSGKILRSNAAIIDSAGLFLSIFRSAGEKGYGVRDKGQFDKAGHIFGVNGAASFYRREMLENIKIDSEYFDSDFNFFYEDLDVAWRGQNFGWKGYYVPTALAYHIRGGTAREACGKDKRFARRFLNDKLHFDLIKNRYLAIIKNESFPGLLSCLPFIFFYDIFAWGYVVFFRPQLIKEIFLGGIPVKSAFRKRSLLKSAKNKLHRWR